MSNFIGFIWKPTNLANYCKLPLLLVITKSPCHLQPWVWFYLYCNPRGIYPPFSKNNELIWALYSHATFNATNEHDLQSAIESKRKWSAPWLSTWAQQVREHKSGGWKHVTHCVGSKANAPPCHLLSSQVSWSISQDNAGEQRTQKRARCCRVPLIHLWSGTRAPFPLVHWPLTFIAARVSFIVVFGAADAKRDRAGWIAF